MKRFLITCSLFAAATLSSIAMATELETEAQKLGYIIGMDIGASLKEQGTDMDLESLIDAITATYNGD